VVPDVARGSDLAHGGTRVRTVEHGLSAFAGLGIWNAWLHVDGSELPALDGSALPFVRGLAAGGWSPTGPRVRWAVQRPIEWRERGRWARLEPGSGLRLDVRIAYPPPLPVRGRWVGTVDPTTFASVLAPARTFGDRRDAAELWADGRARGVGPDNAVVFGSDGPETPLRFDDEPLRHKVLDLLGDLATLGGPLEARVVAHRPGHALTHRLIRRALQSGALRASVSA
jgi:UDP-3-O-[3-hydroxymyristoyl] N-acetylglucosamine deacetylase